MPGQDAAAPVNAKVQQLLQMFKQAAQQKQAGGTPIPQQIPQGGGQDPMSIGMSTGNPHAWGTQRFMASLGQNIRGAVAKQKQDQVLKAEGDWTYLQSSLNELYQAQASGDPKAVAAAQQKVDATLGDPKKLKNMAKALNQDWLNPEKTTVYGEALKKVTANQQQQDQQNQQKQTAAQKVKQMVMGLVKQKQQLQLTVDQQKQMAQEIQAKAPVTMPGAADQRKVALDVLDIAKAQKDLQETYFPPTADEHGVLRSVSKSDPTKVVTIKDAETNQPVIGIPKGGAPKVLMNGGVPYGIARGGKIVMPGSPDWSKDDQAALDGAGAALQEKQHLRIDPIIADQIGQPPNPEEYPKGRSDPAYAAALKQYGHEAETIKTRMAAAGAESRALAYNEYRPVKVMDADGNVYYDWAKNAVAQGLSDAGEGITLKPKAAQMKDIETASKNTREAINGLDKPFDAAQIAKLHLALTTPDDTVAQAEMTALATQQLTDKQQDFVVWVKQLNERAMSLRNVAGMGAGAQDLRNAIRDMIPGVRSGSKEMMNKQMDAFDQQVSILKSGIAHPGKGGAAATSGPKAGTVENGYKFKGGDPAKKENWEKVAQ